MAMATLTLTGKYGHHQFHIPAPPEQKLMNFGIVGGSSCKQRSSFLGSFQKLHFALLSDKRSTFRYRGKQAAQLVVNSIATALSGTPVRSTSILVVGATGTLGRQVVRRALDEGYDVRCLVRPRPSPADFLRDWGATVVNGDLSKPETIPATLVGIHTVIDCATGRPEEPIRTVDWEGKVALIQCAKAMGIQKFVFYSIHNCDKHPEVPLMEIKRCTEKYLQESGLNYTIIRLCGFMQGLIGQYAVPILEEKAVWGTDAPTRIAYMDTQDIAIMTLTAIRNEKTDNKFFTFAGPRAWTTAEDWWEDIGQRDQLEQPLAMCLAILKDQGAWHAPIWSWMVKKALYDEKKHRYDLHVPNNVSL